MATNLTHALLSFEVDRFVTAFCATLDPAARRLEYVNAGHPAGFLLRRGAAPEALAANGPLLSSAFPLDSWRGASAPFPPGARLFLHTDGLTDPGPNGVRYPAARLLESLQRPDAPATLLDGLLRDVAAAHGGATPLDDVTLMLVS
jgi:serine phosphatase RsbU (regulator of sigma subunit)